MADELIASDRSPDDGERAPEAAPPRRREQPGRTGGRGGRGTWPGRGWRGRRAAARGGIAAATANTAANWSRTSVAINRVAKVVKGGRRFSFNALVAVGDGKGRRSASPPARPTKSPRRCARRSKRPSATWSSCRGPAATIPHEIVGSHGAGRVLLKPAATRDRGHRRWPRARGARVRRHHRHPDQEPGVHQSAQHGARHDGRAAPTSSRPGRWRGSAAWRWTRSRTSARQEG